ncbi:MAG: ATP-dependent Clp protease adaptor ClpS [Planctomycetota bacterium]|nr:ATP-dependent Clp protease adaptor ClpS [Planctomycetota bacterium]
MPEANSESPQPADETPAATPPPAAPAPGPTPARGSTEIQPAPAKPSVQPLPPWKVILHNDEVNEFDYVIETIVMLTRLAEQDAVRQTLEAHEKGAALLLTTHRERAELFQQQFSSRKLTVTIEPA